MLTGKNCIQSNAIQSNAMQSDPIESNPTQSNWYKYLMAILVVDHTGMIIVLPVCSCSSLICIDWIAMLLSALNIIVLSTLPTLPYCYYSTTTTTTTTSTIVYKVINKLNKYYYYYYYYYYLLLVILMVEDFENQDSRGEMRLRWIFPH